MFYMVKLCEADCLTSLRFRSVVYFVLLAIIIAMGVITVIETFSDLHSETAAFISLSAKHAGVWFSDSFIYLFYYLQKK